MLFFKKPENTKWVKLFPSESSSRIVVPLIPVLVTEYCRECCLPYGPDRLRVGKYHCPTDFVVLYQW